MTNPFFRSFACLAFLTTSGAAWAHEAHEAHEPCPVPPPRDSGGYVEPPPPAAPQKDAASNGVYLELLGPGVLYSINYERRFGDFFARIGVGPLAVINEIDGEPVESWSAVSVPATLSYTGIGGENNRLELGVGGVLVAGAHHDLRNDELLEHGAGVAGTVLLGYRYQPVNRGFQFRVGVSPLIVEDFVLPWGYLSLGGAF